MTGAQASGAAAPGWYPDPSGTGGLRWWDGLRWTEHAAPAAPAAGSPYAPARWRPLPADAPVYTVWIWLVALLPLLNSLALFLLHPQALFASSYGVGSGVRISDPFALIGGPMYFVVAALGWLVTAAVIVFSWLDYRELGRRGVERPFHWAWSFLGIVYPIGRSVVVRQVAPGRGLAPLWVSIVVFVLGIVVGLVWSISLVAQILGTVSSQVPLGA